MVRAQFLELLKQHMNKPRLTSSPQIEDERAASRPSA
jgi:hypothetical protein